MEKANFFVIKKKDNNRTNVDTQMLSQFCVTTVTMIKFTKKEQFYLNKSI